MKVFQWLRKDKVKENERCFAGKISVLVRFGVKFINFCSQIRKMQGGSKLKISQLYTSFVFGKIQECIPIGTVLLKQSGPEKLFSKKF
jgi:hypothetical protein